MRPGQTANSWRAAPPSRTIKVASSDSRSTLGSPVGSHRALQFIEQVRVDGINGIDQRRDSRVRRGTQESPDGIVCAGALHFLSSDPCPIDEHLAVALALNQTLAAQSIDDFRNRRIDETLGFADMAMDVAHGSGAEIPKLRQNGVFQFVCGQQVGLHRRIVTLRVAKTQ